MFVVCFCLPPLAIAQQASPSPSSNAHSDYVEHTQDFSETVVPITAMKIMPSLKLGMSGKLNPGIGVDAKFGTGFCLDPACYFIATNYHVAATTQAKKIRGDRVIQQYCATGPDDNGATANFIPNVGVVAFALKRDLAILELERPLSGHHGLTLSLDDLEVGQKVDIYGFPKGILDPRRKLTRFPAKFKGPTTSGLLAFDYELSTDQPIRIAGSSGGIVVDRNTEKIVGILSGGNETTAGAVSVQTLVEFVTKVRPFLAQKIFPVTQQIPPVSVDIYPKFVPPPSDVGLQHRPEEPHEVRLLREKAQLLANSIHNFIAVQTYGWGVSDREPDLEAAYEVRVVDGAQTFRSFPDGKKEMPAVVEPRSRNWVTPADEWLKLPNLVGTELRLKVHQASDIILNQHSMKVFQYYASVEDNLCPFQAVSDYLFFAIRRNFTPACYGEVWADENMNILRISERLDFPDNPKAFRASNDYSVVITYGWLDRTDATPQLIPLTIYTQSRDKKHIYWCRGHFTDYRVFSVAARVAPN